MIKDVHKYLRIVMKETSLGILHVYFMHKAWIYLLVPLFANNGIGHIFADYMKGEREDLRMMIGVKYCIISNGSINLSLIFKKGIVVGRKGSVKKW